MRRLAVLLACLVAFVPTGAWGQAPARPALRSAASILIDLESGAVLMQQQARVQRSPASLTKVVTALVVRDRYPLDAVVSAGDEVLQSRGSRLGLEPGMNFTVRQLLYALLLKSGNDVATALAAHHPAGYDHFIGLMNEKARSLGAYDSSFANPHGLDEEGHYSTAWDMAIFGRRLLADPVLAEIVSTRSYRMPWPKAGGIRSFDNHNKLLARYDGTIGVKTGFTNDAGRCLLAAAEIPTGRVLTVVMGAQDHYADTTALFDYAKARGPVDLEGGAASEADAVLAGPPELVALDPTIETVGVGLPIESGFRWAALMAVLGAVMLATLHRPGRPHPLREAADFHPWMEPLVPRED